MKEKWLQFPLTKKPGPPGPTPTPPPTTGWNGHTPGWHSIVWWYPSFLFLPNLLLHSPPPHQVASWEIRPKLFALQRWLVSRGGRPPHPLSERRFPPDLHGVRRFLTPGRLDGTRTGAVQVKTFTSAFTYAVCPSNYCEKQTFSLHQFPFQRLSDKH